MVIAEPTYARFVFKIIDRFTYLTLYDDSVWRGSIEETMQEGERKAKEMGFHDEVG